MTSPDIYTWCITWFVNLCFHSKCVFWGIVQQCSCWFFGIIVSRSCNKIIYEKSSLEILIGTKKKITNQEYHMVCELAFSCRKYISVNGLAKLQYIFLERNLRELKLKLEQKRWKFFEMFIQNEILVALIS